KAIRPIGFHCGEEPRMQSTIGTGVLGTGRVTQAIHRPVLARLGDKFAIHRVMDISPASGEAIAFLVGAARSRSIEGLLDDPAVDVVTVAARPAVTSRIAVYCAGNKASLCDKPPLIDPRSAC